MMGDTGGQNRHFVKKLSRKGRYLKKEKLLKSLFCGQLKIETFSKKVFFEKVLLFHLFSQKNFLEKGLSMFIF